MNLLLLLLGAYIVGGLPTGYIIAQLQGVSDIRNHGSGNIGATNVGRILGIFYFFLVFLIDVAKAALVMRISLLYGITGWGLVGIVGALLLGNCYTPFLGFRGGKGVATSVGILICLVPWWIMTLICLVWLLLWCITATVGISCLLTAMALPVLIKYLLPEDWMMLYVVSCIACVVMIRHISNVQRYFNYRI